MDEIIEKVGFLLIRHSTAVFKRVEFLDLFRGVDGMDKKVWKNVWVI